MYGSLFRLASPLNVGSNVFQYHNGIIDHHTDGYGEGAERNNVQRVPRCKQISKGGNQRNGDCQNDNEGCPPTSQEKEYDQHHENKSDADGFYQTVYRVQNVGGGIHDDAELHVGRQGFLYFGYFLLHLLGDAYRVGSRLLLDDNHTAAHAVVVGFLCTFFHRVDDAGNVAQVNGLVVAVADYQIEHLAGIGKFALYAQRVGV
ncbi:hypothetical protein Barb6_02886 [Bacteroidales bacterium Barb6]|nr:hypothetical protein Barb6_02886 [Bacteroidales bacterium Barb6]